MIHHDEHCFPVNSTTICLCEHLSYSVCVCLQVPLPNNPPWFELFNVDEGEIREICLTILRLYARKKVGTLLYRLVSST